ncbi:peptidoglycan DD-metalloendopeptidase family protein [Pedobacter sp. LMG 31464]|uniref:Peptidoglycan DD-metalloendopeptidase family protein n=1 Tax=Pedobacter planticolens TaxID=2679964 RepID=A0A923IUL4_9SPHI|nr:peptidoglycan DD-metalloendopeptidase family protein [Pedobacter planticolens]MBB2146070.1 peptidoglycan DD-metalloendopeptidase family protein [Pedobacter planticolens]
MNPLQKLQVFLNNPINKIGKVVDFEPSTATLLPFDFTANNSELTTEILANTNFFSLWVDEKLAKNNAKYGIGGYNEHRTIYSRSAHFDTVEEPRRLHLGIDIWGPAETPIYNFYDAKVHSFHFNNNFGDYGATVILQYQLDDLTLYALYGHLSLASLTGLQEGQFIPRGKHFASFGIAAENGYWPPHLHFQLMFDMEGKKGDYPGVCQFSNREVYLQNCPDPKLILQHTFTSALP